MSAAAQLDAAPERLLPPLGIPVLRGQFSLGKLRLVVQAAVGDPVTVVAGFRLGCWLGRPGEPAPRLGRLWHRTEAAVDSRGRMRLDRRVRAYLDVADADSFEVVPIPLAVGALLVPVEDFARRFEEVAACM